MQIESNDNSFDTVTWAIAAALSGALVYLVLLSSFETPPNEVFSFPATEAGAVTQPHGPRLAPPPPHGLRGG